MNKFIYLASTSDKNILDGSNVKLPRANLTNNQVTDGMQIFFGIAAAVAVLIIAVSALKIVISRGNSQDVTKARDAIIYAAVGLVITLAAFSIVTFIVEQV